MNLLQTILEALQSLSSNKLRSALTILGIVIGVGAVIAMVAVGQGAQDSISGVIGGAGSNLIFITAGNSQEELRNIEPLTTGDAQALADPMQAPSIYAVAPSVSAYSEISYGGKKRRVSLEGVTKDYQGVRSYELQEGEFITSDQSLSMSPVVLLGPELADYLFDRHDGVVGETVRIDGQPFRVTGILASKGGGLFGSMDNIALVPLTTAKTRLVTGHRDEIDMIYVQANSAEEVNAAKDEISQVLRSRHRLTTGPDDFTVFAQVDMLQMASTVTGVFTVFLGGIAGISLLVGGIGIMNIMLVSVTERTREIGLRKALGARKRDILIQFLTESILLSFIGGVLGILLGYLISMIVGQVAAASGNAFTPVVGLNGILLATLFSTAVGLFFGLYPANRAASLQPVEALRYE